MKNKSKGDKDDLIDDDFDLDDFDDDLGDESWDEADEESPAGNIPDAVLTSDGNEAVPSAPVKAKPKGKKNNLVLIAGIAVAAVAGLAGLALFSGGSQGPASAPSEEVDITESAFPESSETPPEIAELENDESLPPMPAPMNTLSEESFDNAANVPAPVEEGALTPMPDGNDAPSQQLELAELNLDEPPLEPVTESIPEEIEPAPALEESPGLEAAPIEPVESEPATPLEMPVLTETPAPTTPSEPVVDAIALDEATTPLKTQITALSENISSIEKRVSSETGSLAQQLADTNAKLAEVSAALAALDTKISAMAASPQPAAPPAQANPAPAATAKPEAPQQAPAAAKPTAKPKAPVAKPAAPALAPPEWQLRSAQPGKAVVSRKGSDDMMTIEAGDIVDGLGRIESIAQENDRWIVHGSKGTLSQ